MKSILILITLSTGLLLGCQDKSAEPTEKHTEMKQSQGTKMSSGMAKESDHSGHDHGKMETSVNAAYYTCPMESHKHINSQAAGNCPECGMTLVPVVEVSPAEADFYGCPMPSHSHIRADEAGSCPECGMKLKPMKLNG